MLGGVPSEVPAQPRFQGLRLTWPVWGLWGCVEFMALAACNKAPLSFGFLSRPGICSNAKLRLVSCAQHSNL